MNSYKHFDVISSVRHSKPPNLTIHCKHVEGHQNPNSPNLDVFARLNIRMDTLCKQARSDLESANPLPSPSWTAHLPGWRWIVTHYGDLLCKNIPTTVLQQISAHCMQRYLSSNDILETTIFQLLTGRHSIKLLTHNLSGVSALS